MKRQVVSSLKCSRTSNPALQGVVAFAVNVNNNEFFFRSVKNRNHTNEETS